MPQSPEMSMPPEAEMTKEKPAHPAMEYGELTEEEKRKMEIVEGQFNNPQFVEIETPGLEGQKMKIEYVVLDARNQDDLAHAKEMNERTVIHIPGYGSSYRANEQYEKLMAVREKKRVILISQPSTGGSDMAPPEWRKWSRAERSFEPFAEVIHKTLEAIRKQEEASGQPVTTTELSVSSSSMGSIIAVDFAVKHPEQVKDLVLMHPGGVNEESVLALASRYFPETSAGKGGPIQALKNLFSKGDPKAALDLDSAKIDEYMKAYEATFGKSMQQAYEDAGGQGTYDFRDAELQDTQFHKAVGRDIGTDSKANAFSSLERFKWRMWEAFTIAKGGILDKLPQVKANTYVIYGNKDGLFPAKQMEKVIAALKNALSVVSDKFHTRHDDIYSDARKYTSNVGGFFDRMRQKEKQEEQSR
jgi:pimeloyl-ACP methyl ester carboxylesterase